MSRPRRDLELEAGASAHYDDPTYYTSLYKERTADVFYYVNLAREYGRVLEYGIGNGRMALPMARCGIEVFGVDQSTAMLGDLKERLSRESPAVQTRVRWRRGDMRRVSLGKKFPLVVCPFNAALHLYARPDVEAFLARVRGHLQPRGHFVVDLSMPVFSDLSRDPNRAHHAPRFRHPTTGEVVKNVEYFDYDRLRQILFVSAQFEPTGAPERGWVVPLAHRQFFPQEWEALLHYNGFVVDKVEGDFHGAPVDRTSDVMIFHASLRRGFR